MRLDTAKDYGYQYHEPDIYGYDAAKSGGEALTMSRVFEGLHPEDIKAAIRKRGQTLAGLAAKHGYSDSYLRRTIKQAMPEGERIIADFLGLHPKVIWPDRYDRTLRPNPIAQSAALWPDE